MLAIGGLDPGGGAGILADARAIARAGAFAAGAVAVITVQSTSGLKDAMPVAKATLTAECTEVLRHQRVVAMKIGALGSDENVVAVANLLAMHKDVPAVLDTVMVPTRGSKRLLDERATKRMRDMLVPRATLVTVNAPEAEALTGLRVTNLDEARDAARALLRMGPRAVLVKGGHVRSSDAVDILAVDERAQRARSSVDERAQRARSSVDERAQRARSSSANAGDSRDEPRFVELRAPRLALGPLHGGGCVLASLVAGRLATTIAAYADDPSSALVASVRWAKKIHHEALSAATDVGGHMRVILA